MDLKSIETFVQVAEQNSFTKAAQKMGYTQSAVSFQIKQLEKSLDVVLFERINHNISLTSKGREILELAHKMIAVSNDIENAASSKSEISGCIRIAMADSLCHWLLWDNYSGFYEKYPNIELKIISSSTQEMFRMLKQNDVDLVFTLDKHKYDNNYVIVKEHPVSTHFIVSADSDIQGDSIKLNELQDFPFILTEKGMSYRQIFDEYLASKSIEIKPFLEIGDTNLICHLVEQKMGVSYLPDFVTDEYVSSGKIKRFTLENFSADIWLQMLYHRDKWITPAMKCVMDYLCSYF